MGIVTAAFLVAGAASAGAQVPQAAPAINAARDARAATEGAQQKNAEALVPPPSSPAAAAPSAAAASQAPSPAPSAPAAAGQAPAPAGAGYSYDPAGRRDPFVSLSARGSDLPVAAGQRPAGLPGLLIGEVNVKGTFKSPKGGFLALLQAPDGRTYTVKQGDKVFDGSVKAITADAVVFSQDVNDPLSLVKQREVRKSIRAEAR
ncbi:MAG TPA: hypothetical protein VFK57_05275 [Vicinamibacterales bacterium]|nr:hypothetical protein [Vicinamibacterales bacterium]